MTIIEHRSDKIFNSNGNLDEVVFSYIQFLLKIAHRIQREKENKEVNIRKFSAVKKELYEILEMHSDFFELEGFSVLLKDGSLLHAVNIDTYEPCEDFIKLDDLQICVEFVAQLLDSNIEFHQQCSWKLERGEVFKTVKESFSQSNFLFEYLRTKTKCSDYKELRRYVQQRIDSYCDCQVSVDRIDKLSFKYKGQIENFENQKCCNICFNDFEKDQEICQLPCNHFLCRNCAVKWFEIPVNGSDAKYQCPFCRDDCT